VKIGSLMVLREFDHYSNGDEGRDIEFANHPSLILMETY